MVLLRTPIAQLEKEKFREPSADNIAVAVVNPDGSSVAGSTINSLATITLNNSTAHVGSVSVFGNLSASLGGNVTLNPSPNWIGLVSMASMQGQVQLVSTPTLFAVVNTGAAGITDSMATILNFPSTYAVTQSGNWNLQSVMSLASLYGKVEVTNTVPVSNSTLYAVVNTGAAVPSNTTLNPSPNFIGLVSTASIQGKVEVVNTVPVTGAFYQDTQPVSGTFYQATQPISGTVTANQGGSWNLQSVLSLASIYGEVKVTNTVPVSNSTLFAVVNTGAAVASNTTLNPSPNWIGLVSTASIQGKVEVTNTVPVTGTFWQDTQPVSGTFYQATQPVSVATIPSHAVTNAGTFAVQAAQSGNWNIQSVLSLASLYGEMKVTNFPATQPVSIATNINSLATINNFPATYPVTWTSGATVTQNYDSNVTVSTAIISAAGAATLFVAPASNRFFLTSLHVSSLGRSEIEFRSGATTIIPFTALATTGGYAHDWNMPGYPGRAQADAFVANLNSAATVSVGVSYYFQP